MTPDKLQSLLDKYEPDWRDPDLVADHGKLVTYFELREQGNAHRFAAMLACQQAPASRTEREFFAGRHTLDQQFRGNDRQLSAIVAAARARGFNPTPNMVYEHGLAEYVGDPRAFIPASGGLTHVRQQLEAKGIDASRLALDGDLRGKCRRPEREIPAGPLGQDIVNEIIRERATQDPGLLQRVNRRDLEADIRDTHGFTDAKRAGESTVMAGEKLEQVARVHKPKPKPAKIKPRKTMKWRKS